MDDCKQQEWAKHAHFSQHFLAPGSLVVFWYYNHMILICKILLLIHSYTLHLCLRESVLSPFEITICALGVSVNYCHCCHYKLLGLFSAISWCSERWTVIFVNPAYILSFDLCHASWLFIIYYIIFRSTHYFDTTHPPIHCFFFSQMQCHIVLFLHWPSFGMLLSQNSRVEWLRIFDTTWVVTMINNNNVIILKTW